MPISLVKQQVNVLKMLLLESYITSAFSLGEKLDADAHVLAWMLVWTSGTASWDHLKDHAAMGLLNPRIWTYVTLSKLSLASVRKEERHLLHKERGGTSRQDPKLGSADWSPRACLPKQKRQILPNVVQSSSTESNDDKMCDILGVFGRGKTYLGVVCPKKGLKGPNMVQPLSTTSLDNRHDSAISESV